MQPHFNPKLHHRRSIRLPIYDYSLPGYYFVTLCLQNSPCVLACAPHGKLQLTPVGETVRAFWIEIPKHFPNVALDEFVVMPDHIHGILAIRNAPGVQDIVGVQHVEPLRNVEPLRIPPEHKTARRTNQYQHIIPKSVGSIIRSYKSAVTVWCRKNGNREFRWQRNYFEHVIRSDKSLEHIRRYIRTNPQELFQHVLGNAMERITSDLP